MRLIAIGIAILLFGAVLTLAVPKVDPKSDATSVAGAKNDSDAAAAQVFKNLADAENLSKIWARTASVHTLFDTETLTKERVVHVSVALPFEALLAEGEEMPEAVFHAAYVAARAPAQISQLCVDLLVTIARKCQAKVVKARLGKTGQAELSGQLQFTPKDGVGAPSEAVEAEVLTIPLKYRRGVKVYNSSEGRQQYLTMVREACDILRGIAGNCVIKDVWLENDRASKRMGKPLMDVRARLAYHGERGTLDMVAIDRAFEQLKGRVLLFSKTKG